MSSSMECNALRSTIAYNVTYGCCIILLYRFFKHNQCGRWVGGWDGLFLDNQATLWPHLAS